MTNMFKKSLLATALMATAGFANAAILNAQGADQTDPQKVTAQFLGGNTVVASVSTAANVIAKPITVTLGAEYSNDDTITLTFSAPLAKDLVSTKTTTGGTNDVTFGLISGGAVGDTVATYRVTARLNTATVIGNVITFAAGEVEFKKADSVSGVTVSFAAQTNNGLPLDTSGGARRTAKLIDVVNQFVLTPAPSFSRVIDVESQRRSFVGISGSKSVTGTVTINQATADGLRNVGNIKHTVNADFGWVRDNTPATTTSVDFAAGTIVVNGCTYATGGNPVLTATALTFTCTNFGAVGITINPEAQKTGAPTGWTAPVLPTQTLTATSEVALLDGPGSEKVFDGAEVGNWTLNGSNVYIPYMLYGATAEQTIQLTNKGSQTGDIFATAIVNGERKDLGKVGVASARSLTSLNASIRNAMIANGIPARTGAFAAAIELTTNVPAADVTVYSAYQRGADRLIVVNDSNGK